MTSPYIAVTDAPLKRETEAADSLTAVVGFRFF
jgi:hypothetical protein